MKEADVPQVYHMILPFSGLVYVTYMEIITVRYLLLKKHHFIFN
jgi:hypothetical protein